jgi:hypothetical protein
LRRFAVADHLDGITEVNLAVGVFKDEA